MTLPSLALLTQAVLSGIFVGALYGLLGLGLSLSWGLLRQINLSHFALAFLGAYLSYQLVSVVGMDPMLTLLVIVPLFFPAGAAIHRLLDRFAVTPLNSMLVTFGMTVIVESLIQWYLDRGLPEDGVALRRHHATVWVRHTCRCRKS